MNICVYGASSEDIDYSYIEKVEKLGEMIAIRKHNLIFGAGANGLMGAVARGVYRKGGHITGVAPTFLDVDGVLFDKCTEFISTETMRERKQIMEDKSDAFIMVPGGIGTFEEFFEILTLKQLGRHSKAIVIYNINNYFDPIIQMMNEGVKKNFFNDDTIKLYQVMNDAEEIMNYFDGYASEMKVVKF